MEAVLQGSAHSMRDLATDTREQQREWWRARLGLDDRLEALVHHLGSTWLGPWRCLLAGLPAEAGRAQRAREAAGRVTQRLLPLGRVAAEDGAADAGSGELRASVVQELLAALAQTAAAGGLEPGEVETAVLQLGAALHVDGLPASEAQALAAQLAGTGHQAEQEEQADEVGDAAGGSGEGTALGAAVAAAPPPAVPGQGRARRAAGKTVKFADEAEAGPGASAPASTGGVPAAAGGRGTGRGRRRAEATGGAGSSKARGGTAAPEASPVASLGGAGSSSSGGSEEPPQAVPRGTDLCQVFESMSLGEGDGLAAAAAAGEGPRQQQPPTTAKTGSKHRSRLQMMQAATPARPTAAGAAPRQRGAATAPRAPRPLPLSTVKTAPPPASRGQGDSSSDAESSGSGSLGSLAPAVVVLDGALQALPWESAPALRRYRLYRCPSLPAAAASAGRGSRQADLASTFYALNPSGDLAVTQGASQDWFARLRGWEVRRGWRRRGTGGVRRWGLGGEKGAVHRAWEPVQRRHAEQQAHHPRLACTGPSTSLFHAPDPAQAEQEDRQAHPRSPPPCTALPSCTQGTAGAAPTASELAAALSSRQFFVYLGHGGGDQYIPPARLRALDRCAAALLMGCSSGRLRRGGVPPAGVGAGAARPHYDPSGPLLAYLLAGGWLPFGVLPGLGGCGCVVGMLAGRYAVCALV